MSGKLRYYIWVALTSIAVAITVVMIVSLLRDYGYRTESIFDDKKRVIVDVETSEIHLTNPDIVEEEIEAAEEESEGEASQEDASVQQPELDPDTVGKGKIAFLLLGAGKEPRFDARLYSESFPKQIGLSYSPYDENIAANVKRAVISGREAYIQLPLETTDYVLNDPGQLAILSYYKSERIQDFVKQILQMSEGYSGVIGSLGEVISKESVVIKPVLQMLKRYDVPFIYNERPTNLFVKDEALDLGLPVIYSYHVIDDVLIAKEIDEKLDFWVKRFQFSGENILLVGRVSELMVSKVDKWARDIQSEGVKLSYVSEFFPRR